MNPTRLSAFAEAYAPAVLRAVVDLNVHTALKNPKEYALEAALAMLELIERRGIHAVEHYVINTRGGAFRYAAEFLGIDPSPKAIQHYLEG